jgi:hypothetical protein
MEHQIAKVVYFLLIVFIIAVFGALSGMGWAKLLTKGRRASLFPLINALTGPVCTYVLFVLSSVSNGTPVNQRLAILAALVTAPIVYFIGREKKSLPLAGTPRK